jgi:hypothetical protein
MVILCGQINCMLAITNDNQPTDSYGLTVINTQINRIKEKIAKWSHSVNFSSWQRQLAFFNTFLYYCKRKAAERQLPRKGIFSFKW